MSYGLDNIKKSLLGTESGVLIGDVKLDASVSETHGLAADVTEHPIEAGSDIADNYRVRGREITIQGIITNTPIYTGFPGESVFEAGKAAISSVRSDDDSADPVPTAWTALKGFFENASQVTIQTSLEVYEEMVLTELSSERDSAQDLKFTCTAKKIPVVESRDAKAIKIPTPAAAGKGTEGDKKAGKQSTKDANATQQKSMAAQLFDAGAGR